MHFGRHDGNDARRVLDFLPVVDTDAASANDFMGFQLRVMDVVENGFVWSNPYKMKAVCASGFFGR